MIGPFSTLSLSDRQRKRATIAPGRRRAARAGSSGQALTEGAAALVVMVTVFVLLVAFGINVFFITQWSAKVNLVAMEAAKVVGINKY